MKIFDELNNEINIYNVEAFEQRLAKQYIQPDDVVLELGARYGSVSCVINSKLHVKTNQVVVEPDDRVWDALENNKQRNNCAFHILKGFLSKKKFSLTSIHNCNGYGATSIEDSSSMIPSVSLDDIKQTYNLQFNVLVADCEGFLETFFEENPSMYDELRLIIFEADCPDKCDYTKIKRILLSKGFSKLVQGHQNVWKK